MQVSANDPGDHALAADVLSEEFAGTTIICYFEGPHGVDLAALVTEDRRFSRAWAPGAAHVMAKT
ncbi:hypothetical protein KZZ07_15340 [Mameliella sp. CS4]|uniref:hypothetical protein n=1 Tax=Mameliella sp. CS4 TaxID=2862329 RepID=UPI001C5DD3FA|nr:hypothetical protein [Mameliella sp. CS4]MBW4983917.1 hypothetical protein [Mameliella sp. CS4]